MSTWIQRDAGFNLRGNSRAAGFSLRGVAIPRDALTMFEAPRGLKPAARRVRAAFSLLELMIGIVILGLGMVMVATMFPVAWNRARTLSDYRVQQAVTDSAHATLKSLVRVSGPSSNRTSFAGDLIYDPFNPVIVGAISACPGWDTDTWVHALNLENIQVTDRRFVSENLWEAQDPYGTLRDLADPGYGELSGSDVVEYSYFRTQVSFHQRIYPPMVPRDNVDADRIFAGDDDRWDNELATRRFCWAVLHRLRTQIEFDPNDLEGLGVTRSLDVYYVTLRRPQPTYRYARQDPSIEDPPIVPDPCDITLGPVVPAARPPDEDVMFPIPWRVQVQFPGTPDDPALNTRDTATGIPTEVQVPPADLSDADTAEKVMLVQMFPRDAHFIDEVSGQVYRVVKRRVTGDSGEQAFLTLDREVFIEDVDLPNLPNGNPDPRCQPNPVGVAYPCELLRTVWVFPPPVQAARGPGDVLIFEGSQPVVGIEVRTLNIAPSR